MPADVGSFEHWPRDQDEHGEEPDHDDREQRNDEFHVANATTGV